MNSTPYIPVMTTAAEWANVRDASRARVGDVIRIKDIEVHHMWHGISATKWFDEMLNSEYVVDRVLENGLPAITLRDGLMSSVEHGWYEIVRCA